MRILITGGAGFIGSHTADRLLSLGHAVRILDSLHPQIHGGSGEFPVYLPPDVETMRGDVRDPATVMRALDGVDAVYHFAAHTGVGQSMVEIADYVGVNCTGTATLFECLVKRRKPVRKVVIASSRAVYGEGSGRCRSCGAVSPHLRRLDDLRRADFSAHCPLCHAPVETIPTPEARERLPCSVYGWTKRCQEDAALVAQAFGVPCVSLRYFNVFGSRQSLGNPYTGIVSVFYNRLLSGKEILLYEEGKPQRDFIHVSDVVEANLRALDADLAPGTCLNVGTGMPSSVEALARALAGACGVPLLARKVPDFRLGDLTSCYADVGLARRLLGFRARTTLEAGLAEFVAWARTQRGIDRYDAMAETLSRSGVLRRAV